MEVRVAGADDLPRRISAVRKEAAMWSKADYYSAIARETLEGLTVSWQEWTKFLTTASRLHKYPFMDQVMIYAQRPDATACADYDLWNHKMNRYVRRGSKGIALLDENGDKPHLRYVFDVADTGARGKLTDAVAVDNGRPPYDSHHGNAATQLRRGRQ